MRERKRDAEVQRMASIKELLLLLVIVRDRMSSMHDAGMLKWAVINDKNISVLNGIWPRAVRKRAEHSADRRSSPTRRGPQDLRRSPSSYSDPL